MCGFVGLVSDTPVAPALLLALQAIQHRGQDQAGLGTFDDRRLHLVKGDGLISQAIPPRAVPTLRGVAGIGHVRYPTAGSSFGPEDAQPFRTRQPGVLLAHNGNVTNVPELEAQLRADGWIVLSQCDAEPILLTFASALTKRRPAGHTRDDVAAAVEEVLDRVRGAFSVVAVLEVDGRPTLVGFRDRHGIRPGCYGRTPGGGWLASSESVALDVLGGEHVGDLPAGGFVMLRHGEEPVVVDLGRRAPKPCVFERIYFARPDSQLEDGRVNRQRWRLARQLAREWKRRGLEADLVIPVPDTSTPAAMAMAQELGIPTREGFIKNRYSGRTFIMPDQATREAALRLKLNPIREMFEGKRVLLVDDSIVRGTTMRRIVALIRRLGPVEVHLAVFSPAVTNPCFYGIDMPTRAELVAAGHAPDALEAALCRYFETESVTYLSLDGLRDVLSADVCDACFTGDYVVPVSAAERAAIEAERRA
jgi:amidophosphoribosyltransferase